MDYRDLVAQPKQTVEQVYEKLEIEMTEVFADILENEEKQDPGRIKQGTGIQWKSLGSTVSILKTSSANSLIGSGGNAIWNRLLHPPKKRINNIWESLLSKND